MKSVEGNPGIVIEVKDAPEGDLETDCRRALMQIEEKDYAAQLTADGYGRILKYSVPCYKSGAKCS